VIRAQDLLCAIITAKPPTASNGHTGDKIMRTDKNIPLDVFVSRKAEIDAILAHLRSLSDDHFCLSPQDINWANVGDLNRIIEILKQI